MSKKQKSSTGPSKAALPYLNSATSAVTNAYQQNQPNISNIASILQSNMGGVVDSTLKNPNLAAASGYNADVLGGKYLGAGNPYLQQQIDNTNSDVTNSVNGAIGTRGLTGGSAQAQILARELAKNETSLRYGDYTAERNRMDSAVSGATSLASANSSSIQALLAYLNDSATIPIAGADAYANEIANLWGGSKTTTSSTGLGTTLGTLAGSALSGWASGGFK